MNKRIAKSKDSTTIDDVKVDGTVTIQLFEDDKKVYESVSKNVVKTILADEARRIWKSFISAWMNSPSSANAGVSESARNHANTGDLFRYVYLLDNAQGITPSSSMANSVFPFAGSQTPIIGYCDKALQTIGTDSKIGIVNVNSFADRTGCTFEYEWGKNKATGSFKDIVHAKLPISTINEITSVANYAKETVLRMNDNGDLVPFTQPTGMYCFYETGDGLLIVDNFRIVDGTSLVADITNMESGVKDVGGLAINAWNSSSLPTMCNVYYDGEDKFVWVFSTGSYGEVQMLISNDSNATFGVKQSLGVSCGYGLSIDDTYVYMVPYSSFNLYRYNHSTNIGSSATEYVITSSNYLTVRGLTAYDMYYSQKYDLTDAHWDTHSTLSPIIHKHGYPQIASPHGQIYQGNIYMNLTSSTYYSGYNQEGTLNNFSVVDITGARMVESAHYQHSSLITKGATQTLIVKYRFDFN